jgi:hypothetical protein
MRKKFSLSCLALTNTSPETSLPKAFIQQSVHMKLSVCEKIILLVLPKSGALELNLKCHSSSGCCLSESPYGLAARKWTHCCFCDQVLESDAHLFFGCLFAKSVWQQFVIS